MKTKDQIVEGYIQGLIKEEINMEYFTSSDELSKVEKEHVLAEYIKALEPDGRPYIDTIDVIDRPQFNIFTWGCDGADEVFTPIESHHFFILAGFPSMGKTQYTFDFALKNAGNGNKVIYISLEMTTENIFTRIARDYAGISKYQWQNRSRISDTQKTAYKRKKEELKSTKNFKAVGFGAGDDTSVAGILDFVSKKNPDMVIIDNFNLIAKQPGMNEIEQDNFISKEFMNFAKGSNIAVFVIHHLNKGKGIRGSQKIIDNASGVFTCFRQIDNYEELDPVDKSAFVLTERKDREFGRPGSFTYYFHRGSFYSSPQCVEQPGFNTVQQSILKSS